MLSGNVNQLDTQSINDFFYLIRLAKHEHRRFFSPLKPSSLCLPRSTTHLAPGAPWGGFPGHPRSWEQLGKAGEWGQESQVLLWSGDVGRFLFFAGTPRAGSRPLGKSRGGPGALLLIECRIPRQHY